MSSVKRYEISRAKYKQIKKLDHFQMEHFLQDIHDKAYTRGFEIGYSEGGEKTRQQIAKQLGDVNEFMRNETIAIISKVEGISPETLEEIKKSLLPLFDQPGYGETKQEGES